MGTCVTVIKLIGFSSLGLLSGSLTYLSIQAIPDLITQLNNQVSVSAASATSILDSIAQNLTVSKISNVLLTAISSGMFYLAYKYSPPLEKHPYLIYSGLGAPLAIAALYVQGLSADGAIAKRSTARTAKLSRKNTVAEPAAAEPAPPKKDDEDALGKSYIHVSDDSLSNTLTPGSSAPGSAPGSPPSSAVEPTTSTIEDEVEDALSKKEYVHDLETLKGAYTLALAVAGAGAAVCTIGLVGDYYFL